MVNIQLAGHRKHNEYLAEVFDIYATIANFHNLPKIHQIYGQYTTRVDGRIMAVQAEHYPDDFYDGSPGSVPRSILPDYIKENIREYIHMPEDISIDIIIEILEDHVMFYVDREVHNSPIQGVW